MAAKLKRLPRKIAYRLIRYKKYLVHYCVLQSLQVLSEKMKNFIINGAKKGLGDFPVDPHFILTTIHGNNVLYCAKHFFKAIRKEKQLWLPTKLIDS
jgi:hypothetical protein